MAPEPKDDEFDSFLEPCFFRADFFQIGLGTSIFFILMVSRFQIKHSYKKHIVVPRFDQQKRAKDSSAWCSGSI